MAGNQTQIIEIDGLKYALAPLEKHPGDNPELPSYQSPAYRDYQSELQFVRDIAEGQSAWISPLGEVKDITKAKQFLPPYAGEPSGEYFRRLAQSNFNNFFSTAITQFPGLLQEYRIGDDIFDPLLDAWGDIDSQGNDLPSFFLDADELVIRDGFCGILVEMGVPGEEAHIAPILTIDDIGNYPLRPYLVTVPREDILNWAFVWSEGAAKLERITVRQWVSQPQGKYGQITYPEYRVYLAGGICESYVLIEVGDSEGKSEIIPLLVSATQNSLGEIPFVIYAARRTNNLDATPPLKGLAELNLAYFRLYSEYRDAIHKVNCPTAVRVGLITPGQSDFDKLPPIILGTNTGIDVPQGGDFKFAEPSGAALATTRTELDSLERQMNKRSLGFLAGQSDGQARTAEEIKRSAVQTQATLATMAGQKDSVLGRVHELWSAYYGQPVAQTSVSALSVSKELLQEPMTPEEIGAVSKLAQLRQISLLTALKIFKEGKLLPKGTAPETEFDDLQKQLSLEAEQEVQAFLAKEDAVSQSRVMAQANAEIDKLGVGAKAEPDKEISN